MRQRVGSDGRSASLPLVLVVLAALAALVVLAALAGCQTAPGARTAPAAPGAPGAPQGAAGGAASASAAAVPSAGAAGADVQRARAPAEPTVAPRLPRIGLALGAGAVRGFAHIGVIQVLEEAGIRPDLVVGTSAGSLVAALYASGKSPQELGAIALTMDEGALTDWSFPGRGVIRGEALARYVRAQTGGRLIEQMALPLGIVATDLGNGTPVLFRRGDTGTAVRASSAVPAVFQPVRIGAREYVDGGLVSPVPVRFARQMGAELVLAVDISSPPEGNPTSDALEMLLQTIAIMSRSINRFELAEADVVVQPSLIGVSSTDFTSRVRAIRAGREAASRMLPALKARIAALSH